MTNPPAAALAAAGLQVGAHFVAAAVLGLVVGLTMTVWAVAEPSTGHRVGFPWPSGRLLVLGAIAVHLRTELGADPSLARADSPRSR